MATRTWVGGTDGDWGTAANWSPANVPVNADDVIIDRGNRAIEADDQSAVTLASLTVTEGYHGAYIGTEASPLLINATTVKISQGPNTALVKLGGTYTTVRIDSTGPGKFILSSGTTTTLNAAGRGHVLIGGSAVVTNFRGGGTMHVVAAAGTAFTTAKLGRGGNLRSERSIGTGHIDGVLTMEETAAVSTKASVYSGGMYNHQSSGTVADLELFSGAVWTPAGAPSNPTVTNVDLWPQSRFVRSAGGIDVVVTAENPVAAGGGGGDLG